MSSIFGQGRPSQRPVLAAVTGPVGTHGKQKDSSDSPALSEKHCLAELDGAACLALVSESGVSVALAWFLPAVPQQLVLSPAR